MSYKRSPRGARLRRRGLAAIVFGLALTLGVAVIAGRDGATGVAAANEEVIESVAQLVPDDRLDPRLMALELKGPTWRRVLDRLDRALFAVDDNARRLRRAGDRVVVLRVERAVVDGAIERFETESVAVRRDLSAVEAVLAARAVDGFVHFGDEPLVGLDDPRDATDAARAEEIGTRVDEIQIAERSALQARDEEIELELLGLGARRVELAAEVASTEVVIDTHLREAAVLQEEKDAATAAVRAARWSADVPGVDLSVVALDAYLDAEARLGETWGGCNIAWWMIAGVARIESWHGRYGGRTLRADGRVDRPIIGIALDGGPGVRAMSDTDDGEFDGDEEWDRAVGPLQFIPETWAHRGRDLSGDGYADPQNIYDAAYSAGRYLCALGGDLTSTAALQSAYFGYNNSSAYVADVLGYARRYSSLALPYPAVEPATVVDSVENAG